MRNKLLLTFLLMSFYLLINNGTVLASGTCATIQKIVSDPLKAPLDYPFKCNVQVDSAHAGSKTIACGISINGNYPENFCHSDTDFVGWQGDTAIFNCNLKSARVTSQVRTLELVAFDFQGECGLNTGSRSDIQIGPAPTASPTSFPSPTSLSVLPTYATKLPTPTSIGPTSPIGAIGQAPGFPIATPDTQNIISITELMGKKDLKYKQDLIDQAKSCLKNRAVYEQAAAVTGIPWQVLAGIHFREGHCAANQSLVGGRVLGQDEPDLLGDCPPEEVGPGKAQPLAGGGCGFVKLIDTAIYAGNHLKGKANGVPSSFSTLVTALSKFNGGGNRNCGQTPYTNCPRLFYGEDDTYVMNFFDERHAQMHIVYCLDGVICGQPNPDPRPGAITVTNIITSL